MMFGFKNFYLFLCLQHIKLLKLIYKHFYNINPVVLTDSMYMLNLSYYLLQATARRKRFYALFYTRKSSDLDEIYIHTIFYGSTKYFVTLYSLQPFTLSIKIRT